jgi:hypothetical protein
MTVAAQDFLSEATGSGSLRSPTAEREAMTHESKGLTAFGA